MSKLADQIIKDFGAQLATEVKRTATDKAVAMLWREMQLQRVADKAAYLRASKALFEALLDGAKAPAGYNWKRHLADDSRATGAGFFEKRRLAPLYRSLSGSW